MLSTAYICANQHSLAIRDNAEGGGLLIQVDDATLMHVDAPYRHASYTAWFSTRHSDARQILVQFDLHRDSIGQLTIRVDPSAEELKRLKLEELIGSEHHCSIREHTILDGRAPWDDFTDDLGAFVASGFRMSLGLLLAFVVCYALAMGLSVAIANEGRSQPRTLQILGSAVSWLVCLGVFMGAASGSRCLRPGRIAPRQGWACVTRTLMGIVLGSGIAALIFNT